MLPKQIRDLKQWSHSFSPEERKRPAHSKYKPNGALTYYEAKTKANGGDLLMGLYVTEKDPYLLGDIDDVRNPNDPFEELPIGVADLLRRGTYSEVSPSGKGIRFLLRLPDASIKGQLQGSYFHLRDAPEGKLRKIQINAGKPWMTITGNSTPFSQPMVAEIPLEELDQIFNMRVSTESTEPVVDLPTALPKLEEVLEVLYALPLDQNPRVKRAYKSVFHSEYQHYEYWIKVLMAVHDYASRSDNLPGCLEAVIKWSRGDEASYASDEDVLDHWQSLRKRKDKVTYKTLFGMYYKTVFRWPVVSSSNRNKNIPLATVYENYQAAMNYYDIQIHKDISNPHIVYVTADEDIRDRLLHLSTQGRLNLTNLYGPFDLRSLVPVFHMAFQKLGLLTITHAHAQMALTNRWVESKHTIDIFKQYFDTPFEKLPEKLRENEAYYDRSNFDHLFGCLHIDYRTDDIEQEDKLYRAYYRKWLMGMVRYMYMADPHRYTNNCILLLTGPEQIRKTSHFRYLLPSFLRDDSVTFTTHGFSTEGAVRDVTKLSASSRIVVWDELEQYLTTESESNFKKLIDNTPQKIIDKYDKSPSTFAPRAIYGATSNQRSFKLGDEGSRRIFHIPVSWVDTDVMESICWHPIIEDLKRELIAGIRNGKTPWLLNEQQLQYQRFLHADLRAKNSLDLMLEEVYQFDAPLEIVAGCVPGLSSLQSDKTGRFVTTRQVQRILSLAGFKVHNISEAMFKHTLSRLCGEYTGTFNQSKVLISPKCVLERGMAQQGPHKRWLVPPVRPEVAEATRNRFE